MAHRLQPLANVVHHRRPPVRDRAESALPDGARVSDGAPVSALAALADAELRLDRAIAAARDAAATAIAGARRSAEQSAATVEGDIAQVRTRIAAEIATATELRLGDIAARARAEAARFDAVRGDALAAIAGRLAHRLAELAVADASEAT